MSSEELVRFGSMDMPSMIGWIIVVTSLIVEFDKPDIPVDEPGRSPSFQKCLFVCW